MVTGNDAVVEPVRVSVYVPVFVAGVPDSAASVSVEVSVTTGLPPPGIMVNGIVFEYVFVFPRWMDNCPTPTPNVFTKLDVRLVVMLVLVKFAVAP